MQYPTKNIYLISVGQSNETGAAPFPLTCVAAAMRSIGYIQRLPERFAMRGVNLTVGTSAVGSTSVAQNVVGHCRQWVSGAIYSRGAYALSDGKIWKNNNVAGASLTTTVAPTGSADITTALGDGGLWLYLGVPTAADVDGAIYPHTSNRWDPLGYQASAGYGGLGPALTGYDEIWVNIAFGQQDSSYGTTRDAYAKSYRALIESYRSRGATKFFVSQSFWAPTGIPNVTNNLLPAIQDVLDFYANDPTVFRGVDLFTQFGNFGTTVAVPGKPAGAVHPNDPAYEMAADAYYTRFVELGLI